MSLDYIEIGKNIRRYRLLNGLKQRELAEKVDVTEQHISHIEKGHTKLSLPTLVAIANALSIDCNTLLGVTLSESQDKIILQEVNRLFESMDIKQKRFCMEFFRLLVEFG